MIKLCELHLTDFRSWKDLNLTNLDNKGLWLIQGVNGSGKSSIRQAIEYLLIDDTAEGISADDLPREGSKECCIRGIFDRDGDVIGITKYRNHKKNKNKIELVLNGNDSLTHTDRRVTQKEIEKLLSVDKRSLLVSTIFSQYSSSFAEIQESDRKKILYNILGLDKYTVFCDRAKDEYNHIDEEIENKSEQIKKGVIESTELDNEFKEMEQKYEYFDKEKKDKIEKLEREKDELKEEDISEMKKRIDELRDKLITIDEEYIKELEKDESIFKDRINENNFKIREVESKIKNAGTGLCPVFNDECDRLIKKKDEAIKKYKPELEILKIFNEDESEKLNKILEKLKIEKNKKESNQNIIDEVGSLRQKIELKNQLNKGIENRKKELDKRIQEINEEENPYKDLMKKLVGKLDSKEKEIKELDKKVKSLKDDIKYYEFWKEGFSPKGIPNLKSESFLDALETETNKVLSETGRGLMVTIGGQSELKSGEVREKISYLVNGVDYARFSGGERQRVRIADMFAFGRLISNINMLILDEALELSLDSAGIESVLKILRNESSRVGTIAVISHNQDLQDRFDNVLRIKKIGGVSEHG